MEGVRQENIPEYLVESNSSQDPADPAKQNQAKPESREEVFTLEPFSDHSGRNSYRSTPSLAKSSPTIGKELITDFTALNLAGKNLRDFTFLPNLRTVAEIDLSENGLYYIPEELSKLSNLKRLCMDRNSIDCWDFVPKKLTALSLSQNLITDISKHVSKLEALQFLDLSHNQLTEVVSLSRIPSLKYLFLRGNHIKRCRDLKVLNRLAELDLEKNLVTDFEEIRCFEYCHSLKILNVAGNPCTDNNENPGDPKSSRFLCTFPNCFGQGLYAKGTAELQTSLIYQAGSQSPEVANNHLQSPSEVLNVRSYFQIYSQDLGTKVALEDSSQPRQKRVQYKRSSSKATTTQATMNQIYLQQEGGVKESLGKVLTKHQETISEPNTPVGIVQRQPETRGLRQVPTPGQIQLFPTRQASFSTQDLPQKEVSNSEGIQINNSIQGKFQRWDSHDTGHMSSPQKSQNSPQKSLFGIASRMNNFMVGSNKHATAASVGNLGLLSVSPPNKKKLVSQFTFHLASKNGGLDESPKASTPNLGKGFQEHLPQELRYSSVADEKISRLEQIPKSPEKIRTQPQPVSIFNLSSGNRINADISSGVSKDAHNIHCETIKEETVESSVPVVLSQDDGIIQLKPAQIEQPALTTGLKPSTKTGRGVVPHHTTQSFQHLHNPVVNLIQRIKPLQQNLSATDNQSFTVTVDSQHDKHPVKCSSCTDLMPKLQRLFLQNKLLAESTYFKDICKGILKADQVVLLVEHIISQHELELEKQRESQTVIQHLHKRIEKLEDALCSQLNPSQPNLSGTKSPGICHTPGRSPTVYQSTVPKPLTRKFKPVGGTILFERPRTTVTGYHEAESAPTDRSDVSNSRPKMQSFEQVLARYRPQSESSSKKHNPKSIVPSPELQQWMQDRGLITQPVAANMNVEPNSDQLMKADNHRSLDLRGNGMAAGHEIRQNPSFSARQFNQAIAQKSSRNYEMHNSGLNSVSHSRLMPRPNSDMLRVPGSMSMVGERMFTQLSSSVRADSQPRQTDSPLELAKEGQHEMSFKQTPQRYRYLDQQFRDWRPRTQPGTQSGPAAKLAEHLRTSPNSVPLSPAFQTHTVTQRTPQEDYATTGPRAQFFRSVLFQPKLN